jgi:hypothetical protein
MGVQEGKQEASPRAELNRHSLELDYGYWAEDVWRSFRGKCVLFQSNI